MKKYSQFIILYYQYCNRSWYTKYNNFLTTPFCIRKRKNIPHSDTQVRLASNKSNTKKNCCKCTRVIIAMWNWIWANSAGSVLYIFRVKLNIFRMNIHARNSYIKKELFQMQIHMKFRPSISLKNSQLWNKIDIKHRILIYDNGQKTDCGIFL